MTPLERTFREAILAEGKIDPETLERALKPEAPYLCACLEPGTHDVPKEAILACTREFPSALCDPDTLQWLVGLWQAVAHGYGGRLGVGVENALAMSLCQYRTHYRAGNIDWAALRQIERAAEAFRKSLLSWN